MSSHCKSDQRGKEEKRNAICKGYNASSFMNECGEILNAMSLTGDKYTESQRLSEKLKLGIANLLGQHHKNLSV